MASVAEVKPGNAILDSRLAAYEAEILKLKENNKTLKVDLTESSKSLSKITEELKLSRNNLDALQTENKTLKISLQTVTSKSDLRVKKITTLNQENEQLKIRAEESEKQVRTLASDLKLTKEKLSKHTDEVEKSIKDLNIKHAKEIGKVQNQRKNELDERINTFAKIENNLKSEIASMQKQSKSMDLEYKEIITGQAQRLHAYEQQINIMEKQMNRLSIQNEFKSIPRMTNTDRELLQLKTKNESLTTANREKDDEIKQLLNRLALVRLNSHYDFRNKGQF